MAKYYRSSTVNLKSKTTLTFVCFGLGVSLFLFYILFIGFPLIRGVPSFFTNSEIGANENLISLKVLLSAGVSAAENGGSEVFSVRKSAELNEKTKGKTKEGANDPLTDGDLRSHYQMYYGLKNAFPSLNIISEEHGTASTLVKDLNLNLAPIRRNAHLGGTGDMSVYEKDVSIWIDPLDATQEYTESLVQYVTTMVCVAVKGDPVIGIIHKPFENVTFWAWVGAEAASDNFQKLSGHTNANPNVKRIIVSRSHAGHVENVAKTSIGPDTVVIPAGGAGYKALEVVSGNVDAYIHTTLIKKWDICAGNAILNAVGGKMTALDGTKIDYSFSSNIKNEGGLLATLKNHDFFVEKLKGAKNM